MDKSALLDLMQPQVQEREITALGVSLKFQVMTGRARDEFHATVEAGDKSPAHFEASIVSATVLDDTGAKMFNMSDVEAIRNSRADALTEIARAAMDVNKIGAVAEGDAAKN